MGLFSQNQFALYSRTLDFLEGVYVRRGIYQSGVPSEESPLCVLVLNFTKVVNDSRAILLLAESGFFIQAGILCRSTSDACNLMMHILFEGDEAELIQEWLNSEGLRHWKIVRALNKQVPGKLDTEGYSSTRKRLDDFVHANFDSLRLYPSQSRGPTPLDFNSLKLLTFWNGLVELFLISCLMAAPAIAPNSSIEADDFLNQFGLQIDFHE